MNQKRAYEHTGPKPEYLHEIEVNGNTLRRGMQISVFRRPNLIGGKWVFLYAERADDILFIHVEGPVAREARHRVIREADIKMVHRKGRRR